MPGDIVIRLVVGSNSRKEWIKKAAEAIQSAGLPTEKVNDNAVMKITEKDGNIYIFDPFEGEAFVHLANVGCRILSPQCVLSCLEKEIPVPKESHPIYSMSMHHVTVSCSSVEKTQRDKLHKFVQWMGGAVSKNFTDAVTHLIAGEVGSKKYHVAANLGTPVMLPEWVFKCWERGQDRSLCATDDDVLIEFSCPVFKGCIICVTGLESDQRREVRMLADENGGQYTGEMKFNECTHLIVNSPKGPKYEFARKWKIHCVTSKWFFDSVNAGYCQDENLYPVVSEIRSTSTPNNSIITNPRLSARPSMVNCSAISNISMASAIDDTAMTEANMSLMDQRSYMRELDQLDLTMADAGLFLDGCKVFLSGFSGARLEKLRKIINSGGATRFNQISESISHVVIGDQVPEHVTTLMQSNFRPHVVTAAWLVDSFKQSSQLPEDPYTCLNLPPVSSASPVQSKKSRPSSTTSRSNDGPKLSVSKNDETTEDIDVMQQYLPSKTGGHETTADSEIIFKMPRDADLTSTRHSAADEDTTQMEVQSEEEDVTLLEDGVEGIFSGKTFVIVGFQQEQEEQILEMTLEQGGKVKSVGPGCIADFAIVPINGCDVPVSVQHVVTNCWLQMCLEEESFLGPASNPLFSPIAISEESNPLGDCVLTVSQYSGVERDCLVHIAQLLGASCQEYFSRKATAQMKPNTHLLVREACGSKYKAAKKWKLPTVTKDWLLTTARKNERQPEKDYLVETATEENIDKSGVKTFVENEPRESTVSRNESSNGKNKVTDQAEESEQSKKLDQYHEWMQQESISHRKTVTTTETTNNEQECAENVRTKETSEFNTNTNVKPFPSDNKENRIGVAVRDATPKDTPIVNKHVASLSSSSSDAAPPKVTPSKFLKAGSVFRPAFDTKDALEYLESPAGQHHKRRHARKSSLPLDDFFHMNVAKALQKTSKQAEEEEAEDTVYEEQAKSQGVLDGVVVCVSKKLIAKQADYNVSAVTLGAEFHWTFDDTCTHFIFKGRSNDSSKEFRAAKDKGIFIVSPFWLFACEDEERRVDEASYPHTFNPKMNLSVFSTKLDTPTRTPARRQTRSMVARTPRAPTPRAPRPPTQQQNPPPVEPLPPPSPPQPQNEPDDAAMDGFDDDCFDSDDEMLMLEAAEQAEGDGDGGETGEERGSEVLDEDEGSLEQRENLQRQLEGIMTNTMNSKGGRRRSRLTKSTTSGGNTSGSSTSSRDRPTSRGGGTRTRSSRPVSRSEETERGTNRKLAVRPPDLQHEASQNVQITWDDPTGRKERAKIMAKLKRTCSPTHGSGDMEDGGTEINKEISPNQSRVNVIDTTSGLVDAVVSHAGEDSREAPPSPIPQAPPIRLPPANPPVAPQPVPVTVVEPEQEVPAKPQLKFLLSGMSQEEKIDYSALIEQLGGSVKDNMYFDPCCTHIVVGNPTRNEKCLAALAAGKWVLHKSFFEACRKAEGFVEEEPHEWGSATDLSNLNGQTARLAMAACRWRRWLQLERQKDDTVECGAFTGWNVVLCIDRNKDASFKRILIAGGARVLSMRPPYSNLQDITHAFMDLQKTKIPEGVLDLEAMASAGILCLKPEYIADYLMYDPAPDHTNFFINEIKPIMESLNESHLNSRSSHTPSKRKCHDPAATPRSKKGRMR